MAVNRVDYGGNTLIDLTGDTLESAEQLLKGIIAHSKDGSVITGLMEAGGGGGNIEVMTFTPATTGVSEWFSFDKIPFYIVCMRKDFTFSDSFYKDVNEVPLCIAIDYLHGKKGTQHGIVFYNRSSSYFSGETSFYNSSLHGNNSPSSDMPVCFRWNNSHPCYFAFYTENVGRKGLRVGETYQIIVVFRE